jgi:hypothetical protein
VPTATVHPSSRRREAQQTISSILLHAAIMVSPAY